MAKSDCATAENANAADVWELDDIAKKYRVSVRTVQRWIQRGQFPRPIRMGRNRFWIPKQVIAWMERRGEEAQATPAAQNLANFIIPDRPRRRRGTNQ